MLKLNSFSHYFSSKCLTCTIFVGRLIWLLFLTSYFGGKTLTKKVPYRYFGARTLTHLQNFGARTVLFFGAKTEAKTSSFWCENDIQFGYNVDLLIKFCCQNWGENIIIFVRKRYKIWCKNVDLLINFGAKTVPFLVRKRHHFCAKTILFLVRKRYKIRCENVDLLTKLWWENDTKFSVRTLFSNFWC